LSDGTDSHVGEKVEGWKGRGCRKAKEKPRASACETAVVDVSTARISGPYTMSYKPFGDVGKVASGMALRYMA
jgi:hypothetical protein